MQFREIRATGQQQLRTAEHETATVEQIVRYPNLPDMEYAIRSKRRSSTHSTGDLSAKDGSDGSTSLCYGQC